MSSAPAAPSRELAAGLRVVLAPDADAAVVALWEEEAEAIANTLARWGRFRHPVQLRTTEDRAELRSTAGASTAGLLCGLATLDRVILLAPHRWLDPPSRPDLERALVHELAHVLLYQRCAPAGASRRPPLPTWLREGMAVYVAEGPPSAGLARAVADQPNPAEFARADAEAVAASPELCYEAAVLAFSAWLQRHGERRLAALCRSMRARRPFARAHRLACGHSEAEFLGEWALALKQDAERT